MRSLQLASSIDVLLPFVNTSVVTGVNLPQRLTVSDVIEKGSHNQLGSEASHAVSLVDTCQH